MGGFPLPFLLGGAIGLINASAATCFFPRIRRREEQLFLEDSASAEIDITRPLGLRDVLKVETTTGCYPD